MGVNGLAAAQTLLDFDRVTPGYCLMYVWQAYKAHGARAEGSYPTAYSAWLASPGKHHGDWDPPAGVPVYFGPRSGSNAGDVVISLGGGECAATDWPYNGVTNRTTLAARQRQIGRPYLGWTDNILGYPIDLGGSSAGGGSAPNIALLRRRQENGMYIRGTSVQNVVYCVYTDAKGRARIRTCGVNETAYALAGGLVIVGDDGTLTGMGKEAFNGQPDNSVMENVWGDTTVQRDNGKGGVIKISALQELADAKSNSSKLLERPEATITAEQIDQLAAELVKAGIGGASKDDVRDVLAAQLGKLTLQAVDAS